MNDLLASLASRMPAPFSTSPMPIDGPPFLVFLSWDCSHRAQTSFDQSSHPRQVARPGVNLIWEYQYFDFSVFLFAPAPSSQPVDRRGFPRLVDEILTSACSLGCSFG
jgi:hypothetical protein